jgi:hypothetical protein
MQHCQTRLRHEAEYDKAADPHATALSLLAKRVLLFLGASLIASSRRTGSEFVRCLWL